jgi:hypothetical protein
MSGKGGKQQAGSRNAKETEAEKQRKKAEQRASQVEQQTAARAQRSRSSLDDGLGDAAASGRRVRSTPASVSPESSPARKTSRNTERGCGRHKEKAGRLNSSEEESELEASGAVVSRGGDKLKKRTGVQVK